MEGRPSRGRGGSWKRGGGRGGNDGEGFGGEHRGRGRGGGGHHRGRGKRDHYRGRGRGGGGGPGAGLHHRDQDEGALLQEEEDNRMETFSRRKLESNWDRYEESEKQEAEEDTPAQRGTDYHVLLGSAGDSFTQFRFSEEKDWEMDSFAAFQTSSVFVDLPALAQSLQQVPLHQRLNLEAELVQVSTPVDLPAVSLVSKQETSQTSVPAAPSAAVKISSTVHKPAPASDPVLVSVSGSESKVPTGAAQPPVLEEEEDDEELDQLLSLQKPVSGNESVGVSEESPAPEEACEDVKEKSEEVKDKDVTPVKSASVKQEVTEEDLEDWLDSMIS